MIRGLHGLFYSNQPDEMRAFLKDKLRLPHTDVGGGWLIFDLPEADLGVHPTEGDPPAGTHDVSFYCDDIAGTVKDLASRGVEFSQPPQDHGYGFVTYFTMPGGVTVQLYEPKYAKRASKPGAPARAKAKAPAKAAARATAKPATAAKQPPAKKPAKKKRR